MRSGGTRATAAGLMPFGHLCWGYRDRAEFLARAAEYAADGFRAGQWVEYVGSGSSDALRAEISLLGDVAARALDAGAAGVKPVDEFYAFIGSGDIVDASGTVAARVAATQAALAAGYQGLRAIVDCTSVARTREQRDALAGFEYLIDHEMSAQPVSALCAYDMSELGAEGLAEMACLHPFVRTGSAPFRLYADEDVQFAMAGELDLAGADLFAATLERIVPLSTEPELVVDGRALQFIDHRRLLALEHEAAAHDRKVVLRSGSPAVVRVAQLLPLHALRIEEVAA